MTCQINNVGRAKLCIWFTHCKSDCKTCKKCGSGALHITPGCVCDGCIGANAFKVRK